MINTSELKQTSILLKIKTSICPLNQLLCCENQDFHVNESNAFHLHFLSVQYEVSYLQNITKQYIFDHQEHFAFEILLGNKSLDVPDTTIIEDAISHNFLTYINKEEFLLLPIPILYRFLLFL